MIYILAGFIFGGLVPYMARRFAKFMPATPAYALYRLIKPNKTANKTSVKYRKLTNLYRMRSMLCAVSVSGISALLFLKFGENQIWWWLGFVWVLVLLAEIDFRSFLLPDILTVPLLICGFVFSASFNPYITPFESSAAALAGYVLPVVATLLMLWRSKEAFGGGDIKLLSAIGAWLGVEGMLYTLLLSCLLFGIYSIIRRQRAGAFGPALAVAAAVVLFLIF